MALREISDMQACHPEYVEGSCEEANPPCFDKLSMTAFIF
jgi:hypothetical protein